MFQEITTSQTLTSVIMDIVYKCNCHKTLYFPNTEYCLAVVFAVFSYIVSTKL